MNSVFDMLKGNLDSVNESSAESMIVGKWHKYHLLDVKVDDVGKGIRHCCIASESFTFDHNGCGEWRQWEDNGDVHIEKFTYNIQGNVINTITDNTEIKTEYVYLIDNNILTLIFFDRYCSQYRRVTAKEILL